MWYHMNKKNTNWSVCLISSTTSWKLTETKCLSEIVITDSWMWNKRYKLHQIHCLKQLSILIKFLARPPKSMYPSFIANFIFIEWNWRFIEPCTHLSKYYGLLLIHVHIFTSSNTTSTEFQSNTQSVGVSQWKVVWFVNYDWKFVANKVRLFIFKHIEIVLHVIYVLKFADRTIHCWTIKIDKAGSFDMNT